MQQQLLSLADSEIDSIARAFVDARRDGQALPDYPGLKPQLLDDAYRIQARARSLDGRAVGGWKVGRIGADLVDRYGAERLAGPIFADSIRAEDNPAMPVFSRGFVAVEAEFLLKIGEAPDGGKTDYSRDQVAALIEAVHIGIEIASSPYPGINSDGAAVTVSDFGNNFGLVVGSTVEDWRETMADMPVSMAINGIVMGRSTATAMLDGPLGSAAFLFNLSGRIGLGVTSGQWISTGAITGVHSAQAGDRAEARFAEHLSVRCSVGHD